MVAFGFLLQNFGRWWGLKNDGFTQKLIQFQCGNNYRLWVHSNPTSCFKKLNFIHSQAMGTQKFQALAPLPTTSTSGNYEPPSETFTTLYLQ